MAEAQGHRHHCHRRRQSTNAEWTIRRYLYVWPTAVWDWDSGTGTHHTRHTYRARRTPFNNILIINSYITGGRGAYCLLLLNLNCTYSTYRQLCVMNEGTQLIFYFSQVWDWLLEYFSSTPTHLFKCMNRFGKLPKSPVYIIMEPTFVVSVGLRMRITGIPKINWHDGLRPYLVVHLFKFKNIEI